MKLYTNMNVLEAARKRVRWAFEECPNLMVSTSGGKDSTVSLELAIEAARDLGRLPVLACFLDQESEYQGTVDYMRYLMTRTDEVKLVWFQVPFVLTNSLELNSDNYLHCWAEGEKWMREKEPYTIHENPTSETRFHKIYPKLHDWIWNDEFYMDFNGIRAQESQRRFLLQFKGEPIYKNCRWASRQGTGIKMYPIYDWATSDVWKAIYEHGWVYNSIYDKMYKYGYRRVNMRVSSLIHETAHWNLQGLHEIEPDTYDHLSMRIGGIGTYHTGGSELFIPKNLPLAFKSWAEYRDYLLEHLISDENHRAMFRHRWSKQLGEKFARAHVTEIVLNDYEGVKNKNAKTNDESTRFINRWKIRSQSGDKRNLGSDREDRSE